MLRDYQQKMLDRLVKAWKQHRSVMVQMPTGTGKTHLMAEVVWRKHEEGGATDGNGVLIVAHRKELIEQISQTLAVFGLEHGLIVGGKSIDNTHAVQVASMQTLQRHIERMTFVPSLVIIDEAHHALAQTYRMLWKQWPNAKFLGLTATPCRLNGTTFTDLFDTLLQSWTIQEFINKGWLSDFEYVSASPDSRMMQQVRSLKKHGVDGDYQTKEMVTVLDVPESIEHLYRTYQQFADGKKGIVYAIDREHARHITEYYHAHGVRCAMIDAKTPAAERRQMVENYRQQTIDVLVNVDIFSEGYDCPEVEFIQLARPTLSLSKYLQQVGRGMRVSKGKMQVLILDNVGLYQQFGLPTVDRDWQQLFHGKEAGKGAQGIERCVVVDGEMADKELVNLEMVRIKKVGQSSAGLEIFLQDGRYGVMRNGKVTCPAKFKKVERLQGDCTFFALGTYAVRNGKDSLKQTDVTTVIDGKGQDLQVKLQGKVFWYKGYFCGVDERETYSYINCWDPIGNSYYYDTYPDFHTVAGVEIGWAKEHVPTEFHCKKLRYSTGRVSPRFDEWEMFYNRNIIIARDYLIVKKDHNHSYRISGYLDDSVLVESDEQYGYQQIFPNGKKGQCFSKLPKETIRIACPRKLGLRRVDTSSY
ncbi:MAG: DEAD/DEAH box helicase [Prevotellaceae bacterium]|nr:DEAD/DEAH box helicase [Prevotellaceae bacterium]